MSKKLLIDTLPFTVSLEESANGGKAYVRGEVARCGLATENKRVYSEELWKGNINRLTEAMSDRRMFGELDHPANGKTELSRVSHLVTGLKIENGIVAADIEVLGTSRGKDLEALLREGCKVGVSSRGYGSTKTNAQGEEVVQEDYKLVTFDFVAEPADSTAYPQAFFEEKEKVKEPEKEPEMKIKDLTVDQLKESAPELVDSMVSQAVSERELELAAEWARRVEDAANEAMSTTKTDLKEEFARNMLDEIAKAKEELHEEVKQQLMEDPEIAGAKRALDEVKNVLRPYVLPEDVDKVLSSKDNDISRLKTNLAERDLKIKDLEVEVEKLAETAKEVGYRFYLERQISGHEDADLIRKLVGDVKAYSSADDIKEAIEGVLKGLSDKRAAEAAEAERLAKEAQKKEEEVAAAKAEAIKLAEEVEGKNTALSSEINELKDALRNSLKANQELAVRLYAENRLNNHPKASRIRTIIESSNLSSTEDVDNIIENFRDEPNPLEDVNTVRARVREMVGSPVPTDTTELVEEVLARPAPRDSVRGKSIPVLGTSLGEFRRLIGGSDNKSNN